MNTKHRIAVFTIFMIFYMFLLMFLTYKGISVKIWFFVFCAFGVAGYIWIFSGLKTGNSEGTKLMVKKENGKGIVTVNIHESDIKRLGAKHTVKIKNMSSGIEERKMIRMKRKTALVWEAKCDFAFNGKDSYFCSVENVGEDILKKDIKRLGGTQ